MRWLWVAVVCSLLIHGALFAIHFDWLKDQKITKPKARSVAVKLSYTHPQQPAIIQTKRPVKKPRKIQKPRPQKLKNKKPAPQKTEKVMPDPIPPTIEPEPEPENEESKNPAGESTTEEEPLAGVQDKKISTASVLYEASPLYQENPPPVYPRLARRRGHQGTVTLEVLVNKNGRVKDLRIIRSSGYNSLDDAAADSVMNWIFTPGMRGNQPIEMWVTLPVRFQLE